MFRLKKQQKSQALAKHTEIPNRPIYTARGRRARQHAFLLPEHGAGQGKAREATLMLRPPAAGSSLRELTEFKGSARHK